MVPLKVDRISVQSPHVDRERTPVFASLTVNSDVELEISIEILMIFACPLQYFKWLCIIH